jgi:hypothetical protein
MRFREIFIISKGTKVILMITFSVSILAVVFAFFYYRDINNSEDPRIKMAREFLIQYEKVSGGLNSFEAFPLLDSANAIFRSYPDYESSFEIGLIYNNKCSALLLMAIYDSTVNEPEKSNLLALSMHYCDSSISNYSRWIADWDSLSPGAIADKIRPFIKEDNPVFKGFNFKKVYSRRVKNIITAQIETPRRLSVSLSNKGTIYRHMMKPDSALICYQMALSLWKDNRMAKSNMNVLMGGEPIKPSLIESLFPPDKNKK